MIVMIFSNAIWNEVLINLLFTQLYRITLDADIFHEQFISNSLIPILICNCGEYSPVAFF